MQKLILQIQLRIQILYFQFLTHWSVLCFLSESLFYGEE